MNAAPVDVTRLIRIATLLFTLLAGSLVYLAYEPRIGVLDARLDDAEAELRSDDIAFSETPRLRAERATLASRFDERFTRSGDAAFLRDLAADVRRHGVDVLSTTVTPDDSGTTIAPAKPSRALAYDGPGMSGNDDRRARFRRTHVSLELHGTYAHLLAAIADLSGGADIVNVDAPALRRDDDALTASVPVTLVEPLQGGDE